MRLWIVAVVVSCLWLGAALALPTWWVTLYDGGKPVQVWVTTAQPKVSGDTCRFIPINQKVETVIHGNFSISTEPPPERPARHGRGGLSDD